MAIKRKLIADVTPASGNVFDDLGFPFEESMALKTKSLLAAFIIKWMKVKKLKQSDAAAILEITQPEVSKLARAKLDGISIEKLIELIQKTGLTVNVSVEGMEELEAA
ncbi:MAG: helix-turn-helix domain-containing protein [Pseudomonadota bacterium]